MAEKALQGRDLRRTDRHEGLHLLFGAALDVARQQGQLEAGIQPSFDHSGLERGRYKLCSIDERLLCTVTLHEARSMLAHRRHVIRDVLDRLKVNVNSSNPVRQERQRLRLLRPEIRALAWATGTGRRIPQPPQRPWEPLLTAALLLCGVVPGLVYLFRGQTKKRRYQRDLEALAQRWRQAGKPEPPDSFFSLYHL